MSGVVLVGAQWGDEGKGKVVDLYAENADVVVRYQGGNNAGHTVVVAGETTILHLIPSGILHRGTQCVISGGVVVDPDVLFHEIDKLKGKGLLLDDALLRVSDRAHVITPYHKRLDALREKRRGGGGIGTTLRGIGPCYEDKVARRGLRVGDLTNEETVRGRVAERLEELNAYLAHCGEATLSVDEMVAWAMGHAKRLSAHIDDTSLLINKRLRANHNVLFEGAQGTMLDIDHGTYPFVTSSNTTSGGAMTGVGTGPMGVRKVVGVTKAYTTRVGGGPFPTELLGAEGDALREAGHEYGATTGRPRRCGWLDAHALRYAVNVNGLSALAVTKMDVLTGRGELKICTGYELDGEPVESVPMCSATLGRVTPKYETLPGWSEDITGARKLTDLPRNARGYVERIEELTGVPAILVSVGPGREQTIVRQAMFE